MDLFYINEPYKSIYDRLILASPKRTASTHRSRKHCAAERIWIRWSLCLALHAERDLAVELELRRGGLDQCFLAVGRLHEDYPHTCGENSAGCVEAGTKAANPRDPSVHGVQRVRAVNLA